MYSKMVELLTPRLVMIFMAITFLPFISNLLTIDWAISTEGLSEKAAMVRPAVVHSLYEWSGVVAAAVAVIAAFVHHLNTGRISILLLTMALLAAAAMDVFHTVVPAGFVDVAAPLTKVIPFTWAETRFFNAAVLAFGLIFVLTQDETKFKSPQTVLAIITTAFVIILATAMYLTTILEIPAVAFPGSLITRPYDIVAMLMFMAILFLIMPTFLKKYPAPFVAALAISLVPQILSQVYMAFFSEKLWDNAFAIAHYLKIMAYFFPFVGILLEFRLLYKRQKAGEAELQDAQATLETEMNNTLKAKETAEMAMSQAEDARKTIEEQLASMEESEQKVTQAREAADHERKELADDFELSVQAIGQSVSQSSNEIASTSEQVGGLVNHSNQNITRVSGLVNDNSEHLDSVAAAAAELTASIENIRAQITNASTESQGAVKDATEADNRMSVLAQSVAKVNDVTSVINDIAEQTNLLALNATIEAARAGDAGRGFAVVAHEVKSLAEQTGKATNEISDLLTQMQTESNQVVSAIKAVTDVIQRVDEMNGLTAEQIDQQASTTNEISEVTQHAASNSQNVSYMMNEVSEASQEVEQAVQNFITLSRSLTNDTSQLSVSVDQFVKKMRQ